MEKISLKHAKRLALLRQGLLKRQPFGKGIKAANEAIKRLSYNQIDTISVINRTHHHVLWTRVPSYQKGMLHQLLAEEQKIFEYWSHAAAYLPIADFRFSLPRKHALNTGENHWFERDPKMMNWVLDRISAEGPLQARDFKAPKGYQKTEMWSWKPAKIALEQLFMEGQLMVRERRGFQKVFDLTERVLPSHVDTRFPDPVEYGRYLALRAIDAHGIATKEEMGYLRKAKRKKTIIEALGQMQEEGIIIPVEIQEQVYYTRPEYLDQLPLRLPKKHVHLLSPFDNTVIQRKRLSNLFDFEYQIECYVPAPKRKYGYFVLPILWGDEMVGRVDLKADRKQKVLFVKNLVFEPGLSIEEPLLVALAAKLKALAQFNDCEALVVERSFPDVSSVLLREFKK